MYILKLINIYFNTYLIINMVPIFNKNLKKLILIPIKIYKINKINYNINDNYICICK